MSINDFNQFKQFASKPYRCTTCGGMFTGGHYCTGKPIDPQWDKKNNQEIKIVWDGLTELRKRYEALFQLYAEHIHEHRMGTGKTCEACKTLINLQIEERMNGSI